MSLDITPTEIDAVKLVTPIQHGDDRGFFARMFDSRVFAEAGLVADYVNVNNSYSAHRHTLRGMHLQLAPSAEAKVVRCIRGALFDVAVDLRAGSATYAQWVGRELTAANRQMLYVPEGFAHGFLTLTEDTEVIYLASAYYDPVRERGYRWDDPAFAIAWPHPPRVLSAKDAAWPALGAPEAGQRIKELGASP